jgi:hypothetical protein
MTEEELRQIEEKLRAAGISSDSWQRGGRINLENLPAVARQRELLTAARDALRQQLVADQEELDVARAALARLRHGGGQ